MDKFFKNKHLLIVLTFIFLVICDFNIQRKGIEKEENYKKNIREHKFEREDYSIKWKITPILKEEKKLYKNLFNCNFLPKIYVFNICEYTYKKIVNIDFKNGSNLMLIKDNIEIEYERSTNNEFDFSELEYLNNREIGKYALYVDDVYLDGYDYISYTKNYTLKDGKKALGREVYVRNAEGNYDVEYISYEYTGKRITRVKEKAEVVEFDSKTRKIKETLYCVYQSASSRNKKIIYKEINNEIKEMEYYNEFGNYLYTKNL